MIDLGIHTEACMTRAETCGVAGGAISVWMNVIDCSATGGLLSSMGNGASGTMILCTDAGTKYENIDL